MTAWYITVLDAEIAFRDQRIVFLSYDERNHRLALIARPGTLERPANSAGLDHLAFGYNDISQLAVTYRRLKAGGIVPSRSTDHGSSISLYYADPDGNQVELKVDSLDTAAQMRAFLHSAEFASNPFGSAIDPDTYFPDRLR